MNKLLRIFQKPFAKAIIEAKGELHIVGGAVRDALIGIDPKDIDIVVTGLPIQQLITIIQPFGKTDLVGESFGVIKFVDVDGEDFDIALPRTDSKGEGKGKGHKAIETQSDHTLSIEDDLARRDFTINAIAISSDGKIIDPFGGVDDITCGDIKCVSIKSFADDPLRMLRAIQFAARFQFIIEDKTKELINNNASLIKEITPERVLGELQKVFSKNGDVWILATLLSTSGLWFEFFGIPLQFDQAGHTQFLSEFLFFGSAKHIRTEVSMFFRDKLTIDNDVFKELKAFSIFGSQRQNDETMFHLVFRSLKLSDILLRSEFVQNIHKEPFIEGRFPKKTSELAISGEEFMELGFKGPMVGMAQQVCLDAIFQQNALNVKEDLLAELLKKNLLTS